MLSFRVLWENKSGQQSNSFIKTIKNYYCFFSQGKSPIILRHRVRWNIQSVKTDASVTPDPCFEKNDCFREITNGGVSLATVFVNKNLPLVSCSYHKFWKKYLHFKNFSLLELWSGKLWMIPIQE